MVRMSCTWVVSPRTPPLLNGFLTLALIYTGRNSQMHLSMRKIHKQRQYLILSKTKFHGCYVRRCYGNFFCCDDQKRFRGDSKTHEHVDVPLKTNYLGESPFMLDQHCSFANHLDHLFLKPHGVCFLVQNHQMFIFWLRSIVLTNEQYRQ